MFSEEKIKKYLRWGLALFLILVPWQTLYILRTGPIPIESVVVHASAVLLVTLLVTSFFIYKPKINWLICALTGILCILQIGNAPDKFLAVQQCMWLLLAAGLWWLFGTDLLSRSQQIKYIVIGAVIPALFGLWQFFVQSSFTSVWLGLSFIPSSQSGSPVIVGESGRWLRAFGTFPHPNILGGYLVAVLVLIFYRANQYAISNRKNWMWRLGVILFTSTLVFTFSRSALCVWVLFMIFYHYKIFQSERGSELPLQIFISLLTAALAFTLTWSIWSGRLGQGAVSQNEKVAVNERLNGNELAGKIIKNNWLLGVGPGNYTQVLRQIAPELKNWELTPVHNTPLLILAEWGILSVIILGLLLYYLRVKILYLVPILLLDHYFYTQWPGILVGIILILSTVYAHRGLTQPKNSSTYPH